ncbi:hypothetical protein V1478_000367 [Vespula squamosa]|uniref:Uncharacterized protein n=1 Tax=Vespula squamosa TaxID=30214 RepID=A0ABD2C5B2_VESSQ
MEMHMLKNTAYQTDRKDILSLLLSHVSSLVPRIKNRKRWCVAKVSKETCQSLLRLMYISGDFNESSCKGNEHFIKVSPINNLKEKVEYGKCYEGRKK